MQAEVLECTDVFPAVSAEILGNVRTFLYWQRNGTHPHRAFTIQL